jgi:hypothetical protein
MKMKAVCSMIFTSLLLSASVLFPSTAGAAVCQNTTVVVYSNGMFNIKKYARDSLSELQDSLINYSTVFGDVTKYEYKLAYASGGSQYVPQVGGTGWKIKLINRILALPNFFGQLGEVVFQKMLQDDYSAYWRWLAGLQAAGSRTQNVMNQLAATANAASYLNTPELDAQLVMYRQALNSGKRVLIISHSQGNFYANAAYTRLISENPAWSKSIGNVQVATPTAANLASKLGNNKPHITVPEDLVMRAVRLSHLFLNVLPTKPTNPFANSPNMKELSPNNSTAYSDATYGHNFVKWYLAGTYTRNLIIKGIKDQIFGTPGGGFGSSIAGAPAKVFFPYTVRLGHFTSGGNQQFNYCSASGDYYEASYLPGTLTVRVNGRHTSTTAIHQTVTGFSIQLIPYAGGIGALRTKSFYYPTPLNPDPMYIGGATTTVRLDTFYWDTIQSSFQIGMSSLTMPAYTMTFNICANCNPPIYKENTEYYRHSGFAKVSPSVYTSLFFGMMDDFSAPWHQVSIVNGALVIENSGSVARGTEVLNGNRYEYNLNILGNNLGGYGIGGWMFDASWGFLQTSGYPYRSIYIRL